MLWRPLVNYCHATAMKITPKLLKKICHMAKLAYDDAEATAMQKELTAISTWAEKLKEVDTHGVEPLVNMSSESNVFMEDTPGQALDPAVALDNAPAHDSHYFHIPALKG